MAGNLARLIGLSQALQPIVSRFGQGGGQGGFFRQLQAFVDAHAVEILQARPLLESEGLAALLAGFLPEVPEDDLARLAALLLELAEQSLHRRGLVK